MEDLKKLPIKWIDSKPITRAEVEKAITEMRKKQWL